MPIYQHSNVRVIAHILIISVLEGQDSVIHLPMNNVSGMVERLYSKNKTEAFVSPRWVTVAILDTVPSDENSSIMMRRVSIIQSVLCLLP